MAITSDIGKEIKRAARKIKPLLVRRIRLFVHLHSYIWSKVRERIRDRKFLLLFHFISVLTCCSLTCVPFHLLLLTSLTCKAKLDRVVISICVGRREMDIRRCELKQKKTKIIKAKKSLGTPYIALKSVAHHKPNLLPRLQENKREGEGENERTTKDKGIERLLSINAGTGRRSQFSCHCLL